MMALQPLDPLLEKLSELGSAALEKLSERHRGGSRKNKRGGLARKGRSRPGQPRWRGIFARFDL